MAFKEKMSWIVAVVVPLAYAGYLSTVFNGAPEGAMMSEVTYVGPMIKTWIVTIIGIVVLSIIVSIASPKEAGVEDERDIQIYRIGEYVGLYFAVVISVGAMFMAMVEVDYFWIANTLYLGLVLSASVGAVVQIIAYRRGLPLW